jgi:hypothetical protein
MAFRRSIAYLYCLLVSINRAAGERQDFTTGRGLELVEPYMPLVHPTLGECSNGKNWKKPLRQHRIQLGEQLMSQFDVEVALGRHLAR